MSGHRKLLIIRGLPGSGKSTLAKLITPCKSIWYEADHYFQKGWKGGPYEFDASRLKEAHDWCHSGIERHMEEGKEKLLIVSNTFTTTEEVDRYVTLAVHHGFDWEVIKVVGDHGSIHDVPEHTISRMRDRWEDYPHEVTYESCGAANHHAMAGKSKYI